MIGPENANDTKQSVLYLKRALRYHPVVFTFKTILELFLLSNGITAFYLVLIQTFLWVKQPNRQSWAKPATVQSAIINGAINLHDTFLPLFWSKRGGKNPIKIWKFVCPPNLIEQVILLFFFILLALLGSLWILFTFFIWNYFDHDAILMIGGLSLFVWFLIPRLDGSASEYLDSPSSVHEN